MESVIEVEKGKEIKFTIPGLLAQNYVWGWDEAKPISEDKKTASLTVEKDCKVVAWVGANKYQLTYSIVDSTGGTVEIKGTGGRPVNKSLAEATPKDEWKHVDLELPQNTSPLENLYGGDHVLFIPRPAEGHKVEYWIITKNQEAPVKDYETPFNKTENREEQDVEIAGNIDVKIKFRDYYLLNYSVASGDATGSLEITKIERANGTLVTPPTLEKVMKTDVNGKPTDKQLGWKVKKGDKITFQATGKTVNGKVYELEKWTGIKDKTSPSPTSQEILIEDDLKFSVKFKEKK